MLNVELPLLAAPTGGVAARAGISSMKPESPIVDVLRLVQVLGRSLNKFKVPARERRESIALPTPMRQDIVER